MAVVRGIAGDVTKRGEGRGSFAARVGVLFPGNADDGGDRGVAATVERGRSTDVSMVVVVVVCDFSFAMHSATLFWCGRRASCSGLLVSCGGWGGPPTAVAGDGDDRPAW